MPCDNRRRAPAVFALCIATLLSSTILHAGKTGKKADRRQRRLQGLDLDGRLHHLGGTAEGKVVAVVFLSTGCPVSNGYLPRLQQIAGIFADQGVEFYGVISHSSITRAEAIAHRRKYKIAFPVLFDATGNLRKQLRPTHVPQAIVLDRNGDRVYSGLIDDLYAELGRKRTKVRHHYLVNALHAAVHGRKPSVEKTTPIGCLVEDADEPVRPGRVTYSRYIAPIIQANCAGCHRPGEAAPFVLLSYGDVARRAKQIAAVTRSRFMPPWKPVHGFGSFRGERRLTEREIELIHAWAENGKPQGDSRELPPPSEFVTGWQLGKPDMVLTMSHTYRVRAQGPDVYRHFVIPTGLRRPRLVAAMEFRPGNPRVTHHASVFFDNSGAARRLSARVPGYGYSGYGGPGFFPSGSLGNWLPGTTPRRLPQGTGRFMPARSDLVLQMHYQSSGRPENDRSKVGIYFAKRGARQIVEEFQVLNSALDIPPGARRHHHRATFTLPADIILLDAAPHMHLLGREMKAVARLPNGTTRPLIWIRDWDFNWQGQYLYVKPVRLPKGTTIVVDAWLDNSAKNPLNPHSPPQRVGWGEQTQDEMPLCQFRYTARRPLNIQKTRLYYLRYMRKQFPQDESVRANGSRRLR